MAAWQLQEHKPGMFGCVGARTSSEVDDGGGAEEGACTEAKLGRKPPCQLPLLALSDTLRRADARSSPDTAPPGNHSCVSRRHYQQTCFHRARFALVFFGSISPTTLWVLPQRGFQKCDTR